MRTLMYALSEAYASASLDPPEEGTAEHLAWAELGRTSTSDAQALRKVYQIAETASQPYRTAADMFHDLRNHRLLVSTEHSEHPIWTPEETVSFRICHDIWGHWTAHLFGRPAAFDWEGELNAASYHEHHIVGVNERRALLTELLGQAAHKLVRGHFGPQKAAFLW